jgi:hypothetical protein
MRHSVCRTAFGQLIDVAYCGKGCAQILFQVNKIDELNDGLIGGRHIFSNVRSSFFSFGIGLLAGWRPV